MAEKKKTTQEILAGLGIELQPGEEATEATLEELRDQKGDDNNE